MRFYSYVELSGVVLWGGAYKQSNGGYTHKYILQVEERYNGNVKKFNFHIISFGEKSSKPSYKRGDLVKVEGSLKVNSYKDKADEWKNEVFIQASKIEEVEEK